MKCRLLFFILFSIGNLFAQTVTVTGYAPNYVGKSIDVYEIEDYFSNIEKRIASTKVEQDSSFTLFIPIEHTQKIIIKANKNKGFLYVQPNAKYSIFIPEKDKLAPTNSAGNNISISFLQLDSTDINYKILGFELWEDDFIRKNYYLHNLPGTEFAQYLDTFKTNIEKAYIIDTSTYFKTFVRFSIAKLDNIQHNAERNRYEKHDFYIKFSNVAYENDAYMSYIGSFYKNLMPRLSAKTNQAVYDGILRSSPSLIMKALGSEYTLINLRIRELIMIRTLSEIYHSGDYPQTNIITILDSLENNCLFSANEIIAKNLKERITELVPGIKAPDIVFSEEGKPTKTLENFKEKHLYIQFIDPNSVNSMKEVGLLKELHDKYNEYVNFITVYEVVDSLNQEAVDILNALEWDVYALSSTNFIWKNYKIKSSPQYTLIDPTSYIVSSPALMPTPNGAYKTIDETFFYIRKTWLRNHPKEEELYNRND